MDKLTVLPGLIGTVLGILNSFWLILSRRERLNVYVNDAKTLSFRIYNPNQRPVEIQKIVFEVRTKEGWKRGSHNPHLPKVPFSIEPFRSIQFRLSPEQGFYHNIFGHSRIRITSSGGHVHTRKL